MIHPSVEYVLVCICTLKIDATAMYPRLQQSTQGSTPRHRRLLQQQ